MQRAKNEKLKKQYVDKMLLFLNNKYSRMFKDKKITTEKLRKDIEKLLGNQNFKNFDYQSNLKKVEKSILSKASKIGQIKYQPVQMSKINDLLNFDKDKYLEENEKNIEPAKNNNTNNKNNITRQKPKSKSKEKINKNLKQEINNDPKINMDINKNGNNNSKLRPQSAIIDKQVNNFVLERNKINNFNNNNNIINDNNFSIYNQNNNLYENDNMMNMNNLSEKMRKLKLKEQDEWAIKAKLEHDNYIKEQNESKKALYEKQMKQRELLEEQIKEKKERELKNFINKKNNIIRQNKSYAPLIGENQYNNDLNNIKSNNNNINDEYIKEQNFEQVKNQYNMMNERPEPQNEINNINYNRKEEMFINNKNSYNQMNNNLEDNNIFNNNSFNNNINNAPMNLNYRNNNFINNSKQSNNKLEQLNIYSQYNYNQAQMNPNIPQEYYQSIPQNFQYMPQHQYPINQNIPLNIPNSNITNSNINSIKPNNIKNIQDQPQNFAFPLSNLNSDSQAINEAQNTYPYPSQELTNRNQFSDYDFRKKSGGDLNQYYKEIRMRKQQIRDQYKQIEQENYLNAQKKKEEKKKEKEKEILLKREMNSLPEEMSNILLREKKLKQKNLVDQINFSRENQNNEEIIKNERQKKMEDFRRTLDEQVKQRKKMKEIRDMMNNQEKKQDIIDMDQQFIEDVRNIQNKYEDRQEIFMMNNIIGNNNNYNNFD